MTCYEKPVLSFGSCCVHVGSGVQTGATTPNNVGTCRASWEGYKTIRLWRLCVKRVRGSNIEELCKRIQHCCASRFGLHRTNERLGVGDLKVWLVSNFAQQLPTTCNRVCRRTEHVTSNNAQGVCFLCENNHFKYNAHVKNLSEVNTFVLFLLGKHCFVLSSASDLSFFHFHKKASDDYAVWYRKYFPFHCPRDRN